MTELYWISTLDSIVGVSIVFVNIGIIATIAIIVCKVSNVGLDPDSSYDRRKLAANNNVIQLCKPLLYSGIVALVIAVFCPSTKQGYLIYGLDNTIEYLKSNNTAKQLPDKAIMTLDKFLDEEINKSNDKDEDKE